MRPVRPISKQQNRRLTLSDAMDSRKQRTQHASDNMQSNTKVWDWEQIMHATVVQSHNMDNVCYAGLMK